MHFQGKIVHFFLNNEELSSENFNEFNTINTIQLKEYFLGFFLILWECDGIKLTNAHKELHPNY